MMDMFIIRGGNDFCSHSRLIRYISYNRITILYYDTERSQTLVRLQGIGLRLFKICDIDCNGSSFHHTTNSCIGASSNC